jgi:hypothetical protein
VQVDLRAVERAVALVDGERQPARLERAVQRALGVVPQRVVADALSGRVESSSVGSMSNRRRCRRRSPGSADLVLDLVLGAEDVGVVLREVPHAQQARAACRSARCGAAGPLGHPQRQVAVRPALQPEQVRVARAVHRLQAVLVPRSG